MEMRLKWNCFRNINNLVPEEDLFEGGNMLYIKYILKQI